MNSANSTTSETPKVNIQFSQKKPADALEYPFEYFVTREDDCHNEGLFAEWLKQSPGRGLRFKKVNIHSDLQIPDYLSRKVLREIFRTGVKLNHQYFSGVRQSLDVATERFSDIGTFQRSCSSTRSSSARRSRSTPSRRPSSKPARCRTFRGRWCGAMAR